MPIGLSLSALLVSVWRVNPIVVAARFGIASAGKPKNHEVDLPDVDRTFLGLENLGRLCNERREAWAWYMTGCEL